MVKILIIIIVHGDDFVGEDGGDSVLEVLVCCCHCCF